MSKSLSRRMRDPNFLLKYFRGNGLDVGGKPDPLSLYTHFFPLAENIRVWDKEDGDAEFLKGIEDESFDFVHSSHCLEHLVNPEVGLRNWIRVLRPFGHLIVTIPDEDLYEQGVFPSTFNQDHKWSFSIFKPSSWSPRSINVIDLVRPFMETCEIVTLRLNDETFSHSLPRYDQTLSPVSESSIEFVLRKFPSEEYRRSPIVSNQKDLRQPSAEIKRHYNQYKDDAFVLKKFSTDVPPFSNESEL